MKHHFLLTTCAAGALMMSAGGALAQAATPPAPAPQQQAQAGTTLGELVVTAERRQESLQDAPVAVSAFSAQSLQQKGLNGGQDLLLQVPNVNYSRSNFGGFDFKIRGIGEDVVAFGSTSGVGVSENELPIGANNLANADFYDVQRVEVVRGPQGTLYGRNATGGAIDIITNLPTQDFGGYATMGYGNYDAVKATGAINIPIGDMFSLRIAGYRYWNDGFGQNVYLNQRVDDRDLGSYRVTLRFKPSDRLDMWAMYEHYGENDNRNRVGKQLCITDPGPNSVGIAGEGYGVIPIAPAGGFVFNNYAAFLNQGCLPGPLNSNAAYGVVNSNATFLATGNLFGLNDGTNVFADNPMQDHNLHDIQSIRQPIFKSYQDLFMFHAEWKMTDNLTLSSITGVNHAWGVSEEDYNRVVPDLPFTPVGDAFPYVIGGILLGDGLINLPQFFHLAGLPLGLFPNGVVNDPQIGTTNKFATFDYGTANDYEYTQEFRLASSFKGPVNFSAGLFYSQNSEPMAANNYYVFSNALTGAALINNAVGNYLNSLGIPGQYPLGPIYIGPESLPNGQGHNYYDARSDASLKTYAVFGEVYWNILPDLKLTLGGRYNVDYLHNLSYPISVLVGGANGQTPIAGADGTVASPGFPAAPCTTSLASCLVPQAVTFKKFTGRVNLDWTPTVSFTDKTLIYASYARGYKGGGFNTPCQTGLGTVGTVGNACPYPLSYGPESIDAFEVGTKNTLLHGTLTLDGDFFYYNYGGYQISSIVDKSSVNLNINAKIYGAEFEGVWEPVRDLTLNANVGYLHTQIDNNQFEVDTMNLTQGNPNYTLLHGDDGTACLAPTPYLAALIAGGAPAPFLATGGLTPDSLFAGACDNAGYATANALFGGGFNPAYENGIPVNLGGHQLPNSPHWTVSVGAQYVLHINEDWSATPRVDFYWQDSSFARVFNAVNDYLPPYHVVNATLTVADHKEGLELQIWAKNLFNAQPITGVYLTNDTSGLFQNVFTLDPRTYGATLTKRF
jgi:outer membrane receptor protein involved in Fe transport